MLSAGKQGADFLQLSPEDAPSRGLTGWLADAIRTAIMDGRLGAGAPLPATRMLAGDLGVSRGVVVEAYQRLADEGLVSARPGTGTQVLGVSRPAFGPGEASGLPGVPVVSGHSGVSGYSRISGSACAGGAGSACAGGAAGSVAPEALPGPLLVPAGWRERAEIDLSPGVPDLSRFPRAAWLRAERLVLERASVADLGYGDPRGTGALRTELAGWLARTRGLRAGAGDIIVVTGVAQALALLARVLRKHGHEAIAVEDPGSRGARDDLAYWGLRPVPVPVDEHGLRVGELARGDARAVLLTPAHQFPTGVVLAPQRRRDLLDWAARADALIVEDDYDAEYRYDRAPVPALHGSAPGLVAYAGSTSKTLAPGMRLGWLIPPPWLRADLVEAKYASDLGSPALPQLVLARLIASGELEQHIRLVRKRQRSRRDALLLALSEHLPAARVQGIAAGLHLLITFPGRDGSDGSDVELAETILETGVLVHPLSWHRQRPGVPGIVLGYAAHTPGRLHEAARRIARALS
jgi:GntR family transcriptional regulator/MocR family aminotransferase